MAKILICGLVNIETTVKINGFPIQYCPVNFLNFGIGSNVSGVGMNVGKALKVLGNDVSLVSIVGKDEKGVQVIDTLKELGIDVTYIEKTMEETSESVILFDPSGKRQIYCDLKDIQERKYDEVSFNNALKNCDIAALCNINFSRPFLKIARDMNKLIATDVHVLADVNDKYNSDFMRYANILFMSDENIEGSVEEFAKKVIDTYDNDILVIGRGEKGAFLYVKEDNFIGNFHAIHTRKVVNTIGAGDSLFSAFIHFYAKDKNPYKALDKAMVFASYKIGSNGAAEGFLTEEALEQLIINISEEQA